MSDMRGQFKTLEEARAYRDACYARTQLCEKACAGIPDDQLAGLRVQSLLDVLRVVTDMTVNPDDDAAVARKAFAKRALAVARGEGGEK